jgi:UDP-N-acetylmuramoyl-L-alanyl-D-glutamate--2,6-diaminopimelate ligase
MRITDALAGIAVEIGVGTACMEVSGVQYDSRRVGLGDVFVAMRGGTTDGNRYLEAALARGARAVVTDSREVFMAARAERTRQPYFLVENGRRALAGIAANLLGHPERALKVSAVTGTNGKTTTAFLLEQMLRSVGRKCVLVGTIETHVGEEVRATCCGPLRMGWPRAARKR